MKDYEFSIKNKIIGSNCEILIIDYDDNNLSVFIDKHFVKICEGNSHNELSYAKSTVKDYLSNKTKSQRIGAVAEFFAHLYFVNHGFKQECLFLNLEEQSPKKGFDGVYSKNQEISIMESKARNSGKTIAHDKIIKIAYNDLKDKFAGVSKKITRNNPWRNAYNHACHNDISADTKIKDELKKLSNEYQQRLYHNISEFNIIPCSTIIDEKLMNDKEKDKLIEKLEIYAKKIQYKKIIMVAISSRIYDFFIKYLEA